MTCIERSCTGLCTDCVQKTESPARRETRLPEELLVVGQLDDERDVEGVLEPLGEDEGDEVSEVHRLRGGSSTRVQEEWVALLVTSQDVGEVAMREEDASPQQVMRWSADRRE